MRSNWKLTLEQYFIILQYQIFAGIRNGILQHSCRKVVEQDLSVQKYNIFTELSQCCGVHTAVACTTDETTAVDFL